MPSRKEENRKLTEEYENRMTRVLAEKRILDAALLDIGVPACTKCGKRPAKYKGLCVPCFAV